MEMVQLIFLFSKAQIQVHLLGEALYDHSFSPQDLVPSVNAPVANTPLPFSSILLFLPHKFVEGILCSRH